MSSEPRVAVAVAGAASGRCAKMESRARVKLVKHKNLFIFVLFSVCFPLSQVINCETPTSSASDGAAPIAVTRGVGHTNRSQTANPTAKSAPSSARTKRERPSANTEFTIERDARTHEPLAGDGWPLVARGNKSNDMLHNSAPQLNSSASSHFQPAAGSVESAATSRELGDATHLASIQLQAPTGESLAHDIMRNRSNSSKYSDPKSVRRAAAENSIANLSLSAPTSSESLKLAETKVKQFDGQLDESMTKLTMEAHAASGAAEDIDNNTIDPLPGAQMSRRNLNASLEAQAKLRDTISQLHFNKTLALDRLDVSSNDSLGSKQFAGESTSLLPFDAGRQSVALASAANSQLELAPQDLDHNNNVYASSDSMQPLGAGGGFVPILANDELVPKGQLEIGATATRALNSPLDHSNHRPTGNDLLEAADEIHQKRSQQQQQQHDAKRRPVDAWGRRKSSGSKYVPTGSPSAAQLTNATAAYEDIVTWTPAAGPAAYRAGSGFQPSEAAPSVGESDAASSSAQGELPAPAFGNSDDSGAASTGSGNQYSERQQEAADLGEPDFHSTGASSQQSSVANGVRVDSSSSSSPFNPSSGGTGQRNADFFAPSSDYQHSESKFNELASVKPVGVDGKGATKARNGPRLSAASTKDQRWVRRVQTQSSTTSTEPPIQDEDDEEAGNSTEAANGSAAPDESSGEAGAQSEEFRPSVPAMISAKQVRDSVSRAVESSDDQSNREEQNDYSAPNARSSRVRESTQQATRSGRESSSRPSSGRRHYNGPTGRVRTGWRADVPERRSKNNRASMRYQTDAMMSPSEEPSFTNGRHSSSNGLDANRPIQWSPADTRKLANQPSGGESTSRSSEPQQQHQLGSRHQLSAPRTQYQLGSAVDVHHSRAPIIKTFRVAPAEGASSRVPRPTTSNYLTDVGERQQTPMTSAPNPNNYQRQHRDQSLVFAGNWSPPTLSGFSPQPGLPVQFQQHAQYQSQFPVSQRPQLVQNEQQSFGQQQNYGQQQFQPAQYQRFSDDGRYLKSESSPAHYVSRPIGFSPQYPSLINQNQQQTLPNTTAWSITTFPYPQPTNDAYNYFSVYQQQQQHQTQKLDTANRAQSPQYPNGNRYSNYGQATSASLDNQQLAASSSGAQFGRLPALDYSSFQAGPESRGSVQNWPATPSVGATYVNPANNLMLPNRSPPQEPITGNAQSGVMMGVAPNMYHLVAPEVLAKQQHAPLIVHHQQQNSQQPSIHVAPPPPPPVVSGKESPQGNQRSSERSPDTSTPGGQQQQHPRGARNAQSSQSVAPIGGNGNADVNADNMLTINVKTHASIGPNQLFWEAAAREALEQHRTSANPSDINGHQSQVSSVGQVENLAGKVPMSNGHLPPQHRELPPSPQLQPTSMPLMSRRPLAAMRMVGSSGAAYDPAYQVTGTGSQTTNGHAYAGRATAHMAAAAAVPEPHYFGPNTFADLAQVQSFATNPHELSYVDAQGFFGPMSPYGAAMESDGFSAAAAAANFMAAAAAMPASSFESPPNRATGSADSGASSAAQSPRPTNESKQLLKKGTAVISAALPLATPVSVSDPFGWPVGYGSEAAKTLIKVNHIAPPPSYLIPAEKLSQLAGNKALAAGQQDLLVPMSSSVAGTWSSLAPQSQRSHWSMQNRGPQSQPNYYVGSSAESTSASTNHHMISPATTNFIQLTISTRPPEAKTKSIWQRLRALRLNRVALSSNSTAHLRRKRGIVEQVTNMVKRPAKIILGINGREHKKQLVLSPSESQLHPRFVAPPNTQLAIVNEGTKASFIPLVDHYNMFDSMENDLFAKALMFSQQQQQKHHQLHQNSLLTKPDQQRGMMGAQSMQVPLYASLNGDSNDNLMRHVGYSQNDPIGHLGLTDASAQGHHHQQHPALEHETAELSFLHELDAQSSNVLEPPANEPGALKHQNQSPGARQRIKQLSKDLLNSSKKPLSKLRKITSFSKLTIGNNQSVAASNKSIVAVNPTRLVFAQPLAQNQFGQATNSIQQQISLAQKFNNIISPSIMMSPTSVNSLDSFNRFAQPIRSWHQQQSQQFNPLSSVVTTTNLRPSQPVGGEQHLLPLVSHMSQSMSPYTLITDQNRATHSQYNPNLRPNLAQMQAQQSNLFNTGNPMMQATSHITSSSNPPLSRQSINNNATLERANYGAQTQGPFLFQSLMGQLRPQANAKANSRAERSDLMSHLARALIDLQPFEDQSLNHEPRNQTGDTLQYTRPMINLRRASDFELNNNWPHRRLLPRTSSSGLATSASALQRRPTTLRSLTSPATPAQQLQAHPQPHQQRQQLAMLRPTRHEQPSGGSGHSANGQQYKILDPRHQYPPQQFGAHQMQASTQHQYVQTSEPQIATDHPQQHFADLSHHNRNQFNLVNHSTGEQTFGAAIRYTDAEIFPASSNQQSVETFISAGQASDQSGESILSSEQASKLVGGDDASNLNVLLASTTSDDQQPTEQHKIRSQSSIEHQASSLPVTNGEFTLEQQQQFQQQLLNQQQNLFIPPSSNLFASNYLSKPRLPKLIPSINSMASKFRQHLYQTFRLTNPLASSKWPNTLSGSNSLPLAGVGAGYGNFLMSPTAKFHPASFMLPANFAQGQPVDHLVSSTNYYKSLQQQQQQPQISDEKSTIGSFNVLGQFDSSQSPAHSTSQFFSGKKQAQAFPMSTNSPVQIPMQLGSKIIQQQAQTGQFDSVSMIAGEEQPIDETHVRVYPSQSHQIARPSHFPSGQMNISHSSGAKFHIQSPASASDFNGTSIDTTEASVGVIPSSIGEIYDQDHELYIDSNNTDPIGIVSLNSSSSSNDFLVNSLIESDSSLSTDPINGTNGDQLSQHQHQLHNVMTDVSGNLITSDGTYIAEEQHPPVEVKGSSQQKPAKIMRKRPFNLPARVHLNLNNGKSRPLNVSQADLQYEPEAEENHRPQIVHELRGSSAKSQRQYDRLPASVEAQQQVDHELALVESGEHSTGGGQRPITHQSEEQYELERVVTRPVGGEQLNANSKKSRLTKYKHAHKIKLAATKQPIEQSQAELRLQQSSNSNADYQVIKAKQLVNENSAMILHLANGTTIKKHHQQSPSMLTSNSEASPIEMSLQSQADSTTLGEDQQQQHQDQHQNLVDHQVVYEPHSSPEESMGDSQDEQQTSNENNYGSQLLSSAQARRNDGSSKRANSNGLEYDFKPVNGGGGGAGAHGNFSLADSSGRGSQNESANEVVVTNSIATQYSSPLRPIILDGNNSAVSVQGNFAATSMGNSHQPNGSNHEQYVLIDQPVILTGGSGASTTSTGRLRAETSAGNTQDSLANSDSKIDDADQQPVVFVSTKPERVIQHHQYARKRPLKLPKRAQMRQNANDWSSPSASSVPISPSSLGSQSVKIMNAAATSNSNMDSHLDQSGNSASGSSMIVSTTNLTSSLAQRHKTSPMTKPTRTPISMTSGQLAANSTGSSLASIIRDSFTRAPKSKVRWQGVGQTNNRTKPASDGLSSSETSRSEQAWIVGGMTHQAYAGSSPTNPPSLPDSITITQLASNHQSSYQHNHHSSNHKLETSTTTTSTTSSPTIALAPASDTHRNSSADRHEAESIGLPVVELAPIVGDASRASVESTSQKIADINSNHSPRHNHHNYANHQTIGMQNNSTPTADYKHLSQAQQPANHRPYSDLEPENYHQRAPKPTDSRTAPTSFRLSPSTPTLTSQAPIQHQVPATESPADTPTQPSVQPEVGEGAGSSYTARAASEPASSDLVGVSIASDAVERRTDLLSAGDTKSSVSGRDDASLVGGHHLSELDYNDNGADSPLHQARAQHLAELALASATSGREPALSSSSGGGLRLGDEFGSQLTGTISLSASPTPLPNRSTTEPQVAAISELVVDKHSRD